MTGDELLQRRRALGYTQKELAYLLGVWPTTWCRWERGEKAIGHPTMLDLALRYIEDQERVAVPRIAPQGHLQRP